MTSKKRKEKEATMGIALKDLLKEVKELGFSGRCWGTKNSVLWGSHCTFGLGDEAVSVHIKNGEINIVEYKISKTATILGDKIRKILEAEDITTAK